MKKTILINLSDLKIKGDVIHFSGEEFSLFDEVEENEVALTIEEDLVKKKSYETGVLFFDLNSIWSRNRREEVILEMMNYVEKDGYIYIWDLNKNFGEAIDVELKVLLPNNEFKKKEIKNKNIFSCLNIEELEKILEKNCKIEETKVWEDMFYLKAQKI